MQLTNSESKHSETFRSTFMPAALVLNRAYFVCNDNYLVSARFFKLNILVVNHTNIVVFSFTNKKKLF